MPSSEFNTWNRALHFGVSHGGLTGRILRERTLEIVYIDKARQFDHIEWKLNNRDGLLTDPRYLALGMIAHVKFGYLDGTFPWKAFIINRLQGGVGVANKINPPVTENEAVITYHGRNRNAKGGHPVKNWSKRAPRPRKKPGKIYPPTSDVTGKEMVLPSYDASFIPGRSTDEVVQFIARRNGYIGALAIIESTNDHIEGYTIQEGMSDRQALESLADACRFMLRIDGDLLRFHSPTYSAAVEPIVEKLVYGGGPDILSLDIDADFRLPLPTKVTAHGYDPRYNASFSRAVEMEEGNRTIATGTLLNDLGKDPARRSNLMREEIGTIIGSKGTASIRAQQRFIRRNWNTFQLNVKVVGNPKLLATRRVQIAGTGSQLVDGIWYISEATHTVDHDTYITEIKLKHPPKSRPPKGGVHADYSANLEAAPGNMHPGTGMALNQYRPQKSRGARRVRRQPTNIKRSR